MIYELRARLFFWNRQGVDDIIDKIRDHFDDCAIVNPDSENEELSIYELIQNHHDEEPNAPCEVLISVTNAPPPID